MWECLIVEVPLEKNLKSPTDSLDEMFLVGQISHCSCSLWVLRSQMIGTPGRIQKNYLIRFASPGTVKMTPRHVSQEVDEVGELRHESKQVCLWEHMICLVLDMLSWGSLWDILMGIPRDTFREETGLEILVWDPLTNRWKLKTSYKNKILPKISGSRDADPGGACEEPKLEELEGNLWTGFQQMQCTDTLYFHFTLPLGWDVERVKVKTKHFPDALVTAVSSDN